MLARSDFHAKRVNFTHCRVVVPLVSANSLVSKKPSFSSSELSVPAPWKAEIGLEFFSICVDLSNLRLNYHLLIPWAHSNARAEVFPSCAEEFCLAPFVSPNRHLCLEYRRNPFKLLIEIRNEMTVPVTTRRQFLQGSVLA